MITVQLFLSSYILYFLFIKFSLTFISGEVRLEILASHSDECALVTHGVTIVRCTKHCYTLPIMGHLIPFILNYKETIDTLWLGHRNDHQWYTLYNLES